jgi:hypothetical protein
MGQTADEIAAGIARRREDLGRDLDDLEQKLAAAADWRAHFRQHTGAVLIGALAVGALLAMTIARR